MLSEINLDQLQLLRRFLLTSFQGAVISGVNIDDMNKELGKAIMYIEKQKVEAKAREGYRNENN